MGIYKDDQSGRGQEAEANKKAASYAADGSKETVHHFQSKGGDTMKQRIMKIAAQVWDWLQLQRAGWRAVNYGNEI